MKAHPALFRESRGRGRGRGRGESGEGEGVSQKKKALLPSKHSWRYYYPANTLGGLYVGPTTNIRTWDIGGFGKSATGGTDHAGPT